MRRHVFSPLGSNIDIITDNYHIPLDVLIAVVSTHKRFIVLTLGKALDKMFFESKSIDIFLTFPQKHMLWVLIRSASVRRF